LSGARRRLKGLAGVSIDEEGPISNQETESDIRKSQNTATGQADSYYAVLNGANPYWSVETQRHTFRGV